MPRPETLVPQLRLKNEVVAPKWRFQNTILKSVLAECESEEKPKRRIFGNPYFGIFEK